MQTIIKSLATALPELSEVVVVMAAIQLVFAISGMQLFMGRMGECTRPYVTTKEECLTQRSAELLWQAELSAQDAFSSLWDEEGGSSKGKPSGKPKSLFHHGLNWLTKSAPPPPPVPPRPPSPLPAAPPSSPPHPPLHAFALLEDACALCCERNGRSVPRASSGARRRASSPTRSVGRLFF